jgi:putative heme iron utilization protein
MSATSSPSHAASCRTLVARARWATLSTIAREPAGYPFGSLVAVAADAQGSPILLLSKLAEHRQNLDARSEASLLVTEAIDAGADPLAHARVTMLGPCRRVDAAEAPALRGVFLALHPSASTYVDFADFAFYRLTVEALRFVGGFGRMSWVDADAYRALTPPASREPSGGR